MARRRIREEPREAVPSEFLDPAHPVWHDLDALAEFAYRYGLNYIELARQRPGYALCGSRKNAIIQWAEANGVMAGTMPAWGTLAAAGIPPARAHRTCPH